MSEAPTPYVSGRSPGRLAFEDMDQRYELKMRSLIRLGMPAVFGTLERQFDLESMRVEGIVPIMFHLEFETFARPLTFFGKAEMDFRLCLRRYVEPAPSEGSRGRVERLLLDMTIDVEGQEGSGDPMSFGGGRTSQRLVPAGRLRAVHAITRPLAPPGERQVTEVPSALRSLVEQPWDEPFPSVEGLSEVPGSLRACDAGPWQEQRTVWGLHNTDVNQHVNVQEYIVGLENHGARMLFGANLPVERHRAERLSILFRKPAFMGDAQGVRGQLYADERHTLMLGGYHRVDPEGGLEPRPSVFARLEGAIEPAS